MSESEFKEFIDVEIPCALFHVMPTDIDKETGVRCDELILLRLLNEKPQALKYKSLQWFTITFLN
jgi:hypothetical protein